MHSVLISALLTSSSYRALPASGAMPWTIVGDNQNNSAWSAMWTRSCKLGMIASQLSKSLVNGIAMVQSHPCTTPSSLVLWRTPSMRWAMHMPDWRGHTHARTTMAASIIRIQRQIKAYEKSHDQLRRVKPVPIIVIVYILQMAYDESRDVAATAIEDLICIDFFSCSGQENTPAPHRMTHLFASRRWASTSKTGSWIYFSVRMPNWTPPRPCHIHSPHRRMAPVTKIPCKVSVAVLSVAPYEPQSDASSTIN
jgi:hypothetical protein